MDLNHSDAIEIGKALEVLGMGAIPCYLLGGESTGKKSKFIRPYSYDEFTLWKGPGKPNGSVYSDRLMQWDFEKHDELCKKHFGNTGQYWNGRDPKKIEEFLRDYLGYPTLVLCEIVEGCNESNGYPWWCFLFMAPHAHPAFDERRSPPVGAGAEPSPICT